MTARKKTNSRVKPTNEQIRFELPLGVKLRRTIRLGDEFQRAIAWSPDGRLLAIPTNRTVLLWDVETETSVRTLKVNAKHITSLAWSPDGRLLASGAYSGALKLFDINTGQLIHRIKETPKKLEDVAWSPNGKILASVFTDGQVLLWDIESGVLLKEFKGPFPQLSVEWSPNGEKLATSSHSLCIWDVATGELQGSMEGGGLYDAKWFPSKEMVFIAAASSKEKVFIHDLNKKAALVELEGNIGHVRCVDFSPDGRLLASGSEDIRLWECNTWRPVANILLGGLGRGSSLAFHPRLPLLASLNYHRTAADKTYESTVNILELDFESLLSREARSNAALESVQHTTAKIVLVGDSGVGKTGLGWRLAHGEFKEHSSTHGQQFWVLNQLSTRRSDGTECEAILWDLAGQPDYRLIHALFLDEADLALVVFDPTDSRDPLHGVEFWLKQLKACYSSQLSEQQTEPKENQNGSPMILIGGRADRGEARLTQEELYEFCRQRGIGGGYLATSAKENIGLDELLRRMKAQIPWDQKTTTVTTVTFKRIKDYVLRLKENRRRKKIIVSPQELRPMLEKQVKGWKFTYAEMMRAIGHLANYGYVQVLRTSVGDERILLVPELLNNLAASFVLEARRNPKGLGSLEEKRLLTGGYQFQELEKLSGEERNTLLDSAALLFLKHNLCFRETDPLSGQSYLVFPELINLKKPTLEGEQLTRDGVSYTVSGAVENVYASLVVLLGYTQTFTRTNQWHSHARYEVGDGLICGFRQDSERDTELDLVLYFGTNVGQPVQTLFQGLFESFLARRNLNVFRFEPVICSNGHPLNRSVVREEVRSGADSAFCPKCGAKALLPKADEPIQLTQTEQSKVEEQRWFATRRSNFERAIFQLISYVEDQKLRPPTCFVSYAWGDREQERWVERNLATDLQKAHIDVLLDRWENARFGASVMRFVERIEECDKVIVVGTPSYKKKYKNKETERGFVVAAEGDMVSPRMLGTEAEKESVLPVLLAGDVKKSFPIWLQSRVYADFRIERDYFSMAFDLILSLYGISHGNPAVADLRESLQELGMREGMA